MNALLDKQVAIVTGGAQGIGLAIAEAVLAHGGSVLVADVDGAKAAEAVAPLAAEGANIAAVACDVTAERGWAELVKKCLERFGRIDVLVNNAGVTRDGYIGKLSEADFGLVLDVSLKGAWLGSRAVAPLLRGQAAVDRQHFLAVRQGGHARPVGLQRGQGRPDRAHQGAG